MDHGGSEHISNLSPSNKTFASSEVRVFVIFEDMYMSRSSKIPDVQSSRSGKLQVGIFEIWSFGVPEGKSNLEMEFCKSGVLVECKSAILEISSQIRSLTNLEFWRQHLEFWTAPELQV